MTAAPQIVQQAAPRLRVQLLAATAARIILNTGHRMVYSFLPVLSRGLGVPLETLTTLLSLRGALGMTSPLFGAIPDRLGRRTAMLIGLALFCVGVALPGLIPGPAAFVAFLMLVVISKFIFDPALQAYLGDRTPYRRRGLVIAFTELGWSAAALLGIPLAGLLIARASWRAPFLPLAAAGLAVGAALWFIIPSDAPDRARAKGAGSTARISIWRNPVVLAGLSLGFTLSAGNEMLGVVYAAWLERSFGLSVTALGFSTTIIGLAELAGEGLVMAFADRLGKRLAIGIGMAVTAAAYFAMPFTAGRLELALAGLFVVFISFEFTMVASLPLMTELVPEARGRVMTANVAVFSAGRMAGALLGGQLFPFGFLWIGIASASCSLIGLLVILFFVRERGHHE
jgi:MFS transporter, DHA1 family, inner membrane transport protein